ncbi:MAG: transporter substrate-binding domain-containing protein [Clostridiales Family XIII bacterium]|nr:transporter substrate-binding domain-containing protein [Clostridiales Family XIII bacterium]
MKKVIVVLLAAMLIFTGCGSKTDGGATSKVDQIKAAGKLVVYTNAEFPPYEFMQGNEIVGVDVEIGKAIAQELGVELEMVNATFDGIIASIASGKGDLGISGFTITDERKEEVDMSVPYVDSVQYIILPEDSDVSVMEDLAGKSVGAQLGTTGEMLVQGEVDSGVLAGKDATVQPYSSAPLAMQDLVIGRISGVVIDELVAQAIAKENPGYKAIPLVYESGAPVTEQFGAALKKGNEDLLEVVNNVISGMVSEGLITEYIKQYEAISQ